MRSSKSGAQVGDKLGPKLSKLIVDTVVATKAQLLHTEHKARVHSMQTVIDRAGHEVADLYRPLLHDMMDDEKTPDHVKEFIGKITSGHHQWQAIFGLAMTVGNVTGLTGGLFGGTTRGIAYAANRDDPNVLPDIGTIAQLAIRGFIDRQTATLWALDLGISPEKLGMLGALVETYGDPGIANQLLNRGLLTQAEHDELLKVQGVASSMWANIRALAEIPLSPADLADMVVRGIIEQGEGEKEAKKSGVPAHDFDKLVLDTGEPPSITDLLEAYRRGFIDQARLVHGIRQSRTRNEWVDVIEMLRLSPMSTADAIQALVQGHIDQAGAQTVANQNGLMPQYFDILYQTAGEPISKSEAIQLLRRGIIDRARAEQALREGRLKNKYVGNVLEEIRELPPGREISTFYSHGALTEQQATQLLAERGYDAEVIKAFLHSATSEKISHIKHLTESMYSEMYREGAITRTEFKDALSTLGYNQHEAEMLAHLDDIRAERQQTSNAITRVRAQYIANHINGTVAQTELDALHVPSAQRDVLLNTWDVERKINIRTLTEAQVVNAWEGGFIEAQECVTRLRNMGYSRSDAILLMEIKVKGPVTGV